MKRPQGEKRKEIPPGGRRSAAQMCRNSGKHQFIVYRNKANLKITVSESGVIPLKKNWSVQMEDLPH